MLIKRILMCSHITDCIITSYVRKILLWLNYFLYIFSNISLRGIVELNMNKTFSYNNMNNNKLYENEVSNLYVDYILINIFFLYSILIKPSQSNTKITAHKNDAM